MYQYKYLLLSLLLFLNTGFAAIEIPPVVIFPNHPNYTTVSSLNTLSPVQTLSTNDFTASGSQALSDVINARSGVQILEPGGTPGRAVFSMRGFGANAASNSLILLDGQPYFNPDMGALVLNTLSLNEIDQVEIMPSSSALYGDQAVGGVINIITKAPAPTAKTAQLLTSYGSFASRKTQLTLSNIYDNKFKLSTYAANFASNNYRNHNAEQNNDFFINLIYKEAYLRYHKNNQHLEMPGKLSWQQVVQNPRQAENSISYNNQDNDMFQLGFKHCISENWQAQLDTSARLMHGIGAYAFNKQATSFNESRQALTLQPKISGILNIDKYSIIPIIGAELDHGQYKFNDSEAKQNQGALYGELKIPLNRQITTVFGTRYAAAYYNLAPLTASKTNPINKVLVTDIEFSWQAHEQLRLFTKRAGNYRFPKTDEIMFTIDGTQLKPQQGASYEAGAVYKQKYASWSLTAYQLNLSDEIFAVPVATSNYFIYNENLDATQRTGAILDVKLTPIKYLQIEANYNFVNAKFISGALNRKSMPFVASNNLRLAAIFKPYENLHLLIEGIYTGNRYPINDIENRTNTLGGFTIYNIGIGYEKPHYALAIRLNNVTNKLYYGSVVTVYKPLMDTNWYYPAAGINALATVTFKL